MDSRRGANSRGRSLLSANRAASVRRELLSDLFDLALDAHDPAVDAPDTRLETRLVRAIRPSELLRDLPALRASRCRAAAELRAARLQHGHILPSHRAPGQRRAADDEYVRRCGVARGFGGAALARMMRADWQYGVDGLLVTGADVRREAIVKLRRSALRLSSVLHARRATRLHPNRARRPRDEPA